MRLRFLVTAGSLLFAMSFPLLQAQTAAPAPPPRVPGAIEAHPEWPKAKPEDVKSIDSIVIALYDVISGPAGQKRDWDRFRSLFVPGGRLIPTRVPANGPVDVTLMTVDDYVARVSTNFEKNGFFERPIANRVDGYGVMSNVYSTYESRHLKEDAKPFARGINSIELLKSGDRYWIVEVYWDAERPTNPIPEKYLHDAK
jgi:hypothetical protein